MKGGNIVAIGASILLLVGVFIGVMVGVRNKNSNNKEDESIFANSKAVSAVCAPTDYVQECIESVKTAAENKTTSPKDFIQAAIRATIHMVEGARNNSASILDTKDPAQKMAKEDCDELLNFAVQELQSSYSMVGDTELHGLKDTEPELQNLLSAVISYQQTCIDGVTHPELKDQMTIGLQNATQLTSNALAIVSAISWILNTFHIPHNMTATSRRLLNARKTGNGEYPEWLSASDRKLLASQNNYQMPPPNAVVDLDGTGQYKTISAALAAYPKKLKGRYIIYVKAGIYDEYITVTKTQVNVFMYGDGPQKTIVTGRKNNREGVSTYRTASFSAVGSGFMAKEMGFHNTAGPEGHQAVALRVQSDMSAFYNCRMEGYQDTLYVQTHRQFYQNCVISGTVDFIFGDSSTVIQNSLIIARKPMDNQINTVTAHSRADKRETTGLVIQNCLIVPEEILYPVRFKIPTYLGRPWKLYSRTVIMESTIGDFIQPAGWLQWKGDFALETLYYAEYANKGPGAATDKRVDWKGFHVMTNRDEALPYTAGTFIQGNVWLKDIGGTHLLGLKN